MDLIHKTYSNKIGLVKTLNYFFGVNHNFYEAPGGLHNCEFVLIFLLNRL
jgi:hypothetical protein